MDNEAPKYAEWIPEAGGYVANGQVVSRTPQYDANGRLVAVDVSQFATPSTTKNQPQVANQTINNGVTTANTAGSNIDVNSMATKAGSLVSLNLNTENPNESAISSPATKSPIAGQVILTPEDEVNKEYQDAVARNDIQGQINALTKAGRLNGVDYSAEIANLTKQRQQKIQGIDDNYLQRLNEAQQKVNNAKAMYDMSGKDEDKEAYLNALSEYNAIQSEQTKWRTAVGYDDAMKSMYQAEIDAIDLDFQDTWRNSIDDISNQIIQAYPAILNFQYNPNTDRDLMMAQSMVEARMRNSMSQTGMYYSSTTQYAIAQAIGELIPVYEKMAREEMIENFKLLQSTASFLMDLEATQFDMWKSQIQMKWDAANQKQKEIQNAINNANARGYYTNEEAAKVGVAPGTESQAARERALDRQEQIEKEIRNLKQSQALAEFESKLAIKEAEEKAKISLRYSGGTDGGGSNNPYSGYKAEYEDENGNKVTLTGEAAYNYLSQNGGNRVLVDENGNEIDLTPTDLSSLKIGDEFDEAKVKKYITDDISKMDDVARANAIADLQEQFFLPMIDKNKESDAVKTYQNIDKYVKWLTYSGANDGLIVDVGVELVEKLFQRIDQADGLSSSKKKNLKDSVIERMRLTDTKIIKNAIVDSFYTAPKDYTARNTNNKPTTPVTTKKASEVPTTSTTKTPTVVVPNSR